MSRAIKGIAVSAAIVVTGGVGLGLAISTGALVYTQTYLAIGGALSALATGALLSGISAQLLGSKKPGRQPLTIEYAGTVEPRRIIYGTQRVSGTHVIPR